MPCVQVACPPVACLSLLSILVLAGVSPAWADETDNFTCRARLTDDAQTVLDAAVNERIRRAVEHANAHRPSCNAACLTRALRQGVGFSTADPASWWVQRSGLSIWARGRSDIDRCRLTFRESIYGARPYNQFWLLPVTHRVMFLSDSILLTGRVVGLDKIDHFVREGLAHYDAFRKGRTVEDTLTRERGRPDRPLAMTEHGLKGLGLTGVFSYADLAASYAGSVFWQDLLDLDPGRRGAMVVQDDRGRFVRARSFSFADYVTDAWDESINRSRFNRAVRNEVRSALRQRNITVSDCRRLTDLPDARLYVNPECFVASAVGQSPTRR